MITNPDWRRIPNEERDRPPVMFNICAAFWEDYAVFRESFLMHITEPAFQAGLRLIGEMLFQMALKCSGDWPQRPDSILLMKLRAAVGDLRQLQGFLARVGQQECDMPTLSQQDAWL